MCWGACAHGQVHDMGADALHQFAGNAQAQGLKAGVALEFALGDGAYAGRQPFGIFFVLCLKRCLSRRRQ